MEVSEKKRDADNDRGSADATVLCQPCKEDGKRAVAQGFCQTCEEYMCDPCSKAHKSFKLSRNHIMVFKDEMPSFNPSTKQSDFGETEYCKDHPKETIKFYCPTHGDLGCDDCVVLDHRNCKVDYIANVAKDFVIGNELREMERAEVILSASIKHAGELLNKVENQAKDEIERLGKFQAEIITFFDRCAKELLDNLQKVKTEDEIVVRTRKTDCELAKSRLEAMKTNLYNVDASVIQRYVAARKAQKELRGIHDITSLIKARKYRFVEDSYTKSLLGLGMKLGILHIARELVPVPDLSTVTWKTEGDIHVRSTEDKKSCSITGSALISPGLFLLTDCNNCSVKLVDVTTRTVTSRLELSGMPQAVCALPYDKAAVTLGNKSMILLISTKAGQLSYEKVINVSSQCHSIASFRNTLYVSYYSSNPCIGTMTLDGHISQLNKDDRKQLFKSPFSLTVSSSTPPTIYVTDYTAHTVLQLNMDGKLLREHRYEQHIEPESVVEVASGQILLCGRNTNNVMVLTEMDGKMAEILGPKEGLTNPNTVAFCPHTRAIIVGMSTNDTLKVFNAN